METINGLKKYSFPIVFIVLAGMLFYTRFINLSWGLPYPFHPDERNMADALVQLKCSGFDLGCFNPHFFAYGQFPLYLGYLGVWILHQLKSISSAITFTEAVMSLRIISAVSSILTFTVALNLVELYIPKVRRKPLLMLGIGLILIFSPALIQFAHFGTTESLLMFFYTTLVYLAASFVFKRVSTSKYVFFSALLIGLAVATKVSSVLFLAVPMGVLIQTVVLEKKKNVLKKLVSLLGGFIFLGLVSGVIGFMFSPFNFLDYKSFLGSMQYESGVALGTFKVFYTRQFEQTIPLIFQITAIFPFALGLLVTLGGLLGVVLLPLKKELHVLKFSFLVYFLPSAYIYTKWTRFMAPVFPLLIVLSVVAGYMIVQRFTKSKGVSIVLSIIFLTLAILPGISYLSVYRNQDTRFAASEWIYTHIPPNTTILSETANVVDLPVLPPHFGDSSVFIPSYDVISFNFYDLDADPSLVVELNNDLKQAEYIVIPSRRIFADHTCVTPQKSVPPNTAKCRYLQKTYPLVNEYYQKLFSGKLGYKEIKTFDPGLRDEYAEEAWTVFDHPTVRIYKKEY